MTKTAFHRGFAALTASLLVAVVLMLDALAACPELHERLHPDAGEHGHECAVTLFAHGLLDKVSPAVTPPLPAPGLELARPVFQFSAFTSPLPETASRGPPSLPGCV
jgi:hypothetical protein